MTDETPTTIITSETHNQSGSQERENWLLSQGNYESSNGTRAGDDGVSDGSVRVIDGDALVNVDSVIENFKKSAGRLRGKTPYQYELVFRRFARMVELHNYTKRQLGGKKGQELLLQYLLSDKTPTPSRRMQNAALKCIWTEGLCLSYPIMRRHLGELPEVGRRQSPRDSDVLPWIKALEHDEDPHLKTLVLLLFQLGIRPSHACLFRWTHVRYDQDGKPEAIITTGREPGNKHMTPIKARLPPDLAEALMALKKIVPSALPEDPILMSRKRSGELTSAPMETAKYGFQWIRFQKKHLLNHLRPVDLRHWVSTICRRAGLSYVATNALQGHKYASFNMRDRYDCPNDEDLLEEQGTTLPDGPIGFVCPKIEMDQALPTELTGALNSCLSGQMLPSQLVETVMAYMTRQLKKPSQTIAL
jgi:integrase